MQTIDPRFLSAIRWTAETGRNLATFGTIPKLMSDAGWRDWAVLVIGLLPAVAGAGAPRPERFRSWQDWAAQFNLALQALPT